MAELIRALETGFPVSISSGAVIALLGISKASLYKAVRAEKFPQPLPISTWNYKVWATAEIAKWMREQGIPFPTLEKAE